MATDPDEPKAFRSARRQSMVVGAVVLLMALGDVALHWYRGENLVDVYWGPRGVLLLALVGLFLLAVHNMTLRVTPEAKQALLEYERKRGACPRCATPTRRHDLTCRSCGAVVDKASLVGVLIAVAFILVLLGAKILSVLRGS